VNDKYKDPTQVNNVGAAATALLTQCNPRLFVAYGYQRYADLWTWSGKATVDETQAARLLDGLQISIGDKVSGPARAIRPEDSVRVTVQAIPQYKLAGFEFNLTVGAVDQLLGAGQWELNSGPYTVGTGSLFPSSPAEPALPTEADLTPPTVTQSQAVAAPAASCSGKYVVQNGDTVYSIARKCGVDVAALIAANPDTLGINPNYIVPGQELNIPAP
jgi:LysM repeat protein